MRIPHWGSQDERVHICNLAMDIFEVRLSDRQTSQGRQEWRDTRLHVRVGIPLMRHHHHHHHHHHPQHHHHWSKMSEVTNMITSHLPTGRALVMNYKLSPTQSLWSEEVSRVPVITMIILQVIFVIIVIIIIILVIIVIIIITFVILITRRKGQGCDTAHVNL